MAFIKTIIAPTIRPVSLDEAKAHVKRSDTSEDTILGIYLDAAIEACESVLQTAIMNTQFELRKKSFSTRFNLEKRWVSAINSVKYYDTAGVLQTVASTNYELQDFKTPNELYFKSSFSYPDLYTDTEFPIVVDYNAGKLAASGVTGVSARIRDCVLLEFADRHENRQTEVIGERIAAVMFNKTAEKILATESLWL